jgi:hypothetical protein
MMSLNSSNPGPKIQSSDSYELWVFGLQLGTRFLDCYLNLNRNSIGARALISASLHRRCR